MLRHLMRDERGATAIEYGLIATLIALAIVGGAGAFGNALQTLWDSNSGRIVEALGGP